MANHTIDFADIAANRAAFEQSHSKPRSAPVPVAVATPAPVEPKPVASKPLTPGELVKAARARLRDIRKEIKRLRALEREAEELSRLIKAAKEKPRNNLRQIKSA